RRHQPVLLQRRPVGGPDEIEPLDAQLGGLAAAILEACPAREHAARHALLELPLLRRRRRRLARHRRRHPSDGYRRPDRPPELSTPHGRLLLSGFGLWALGSGLWVCGLFLKPKA